MGTKLCCMRSGDLVKKKNLLPFKADQTDDRQILIYCHFVVYLTVSNMGAIVYYCRFGNGSAASWPTGYQHPNM